MGMNQGTTASQPADPLRFLGDAGWRLVWLPRLDGSVWIVEAPRVILADETLSPRSVADRLWESLAERLAA